MYYIYTPQEIALLLGPEGKSRAEEKAELLLKLEAATAEVNAVYAAAQATVDKLWTNLNLLYEERTRMQLVILELEKKAWALRLKASTVIFKGKLIPLMMDILKIANEEQKKW